MQKSNLTKGMIHLKERYERRVIPHFLKELGYKNRLAVPRMLKVVVNVGVGSLLKNDSNSKELGEAVEQDLAFITAQKPVQTKSKKSIAAFGTRRGQMLGFKVTLRGKRMMDFLERLVNLALPRTRDFFGIPVTSFDQKGNLTIGIKEHTVFPEVGRGERGQKVKKIFGFEITVVTNAQSKEEGISLFKMMGFPLALE